VALASCFLLSVFYGAVGLCWIVLVLYWFDSELISDRRRVSAIDSRGTFPIAATRPQSLPAVGDRFCKFSSLSTSCWLNLVCCAKCS